jgi:PAS domain S-box-containing protein
MEKILEKSNIAFVGGGAVCRAILQILFGEGFKLKSPRIVGVADINDQAEGLVFAKEKGIFTTAVYQDLYRIRDLDLIIELTKDETLRESIEATKPPHIKLIDHFEAMAFWDFLRIEEKKNEVLAHLRKDREDDAEIERYFEQFCDYVSGIAEERNTYSKNIRKELVESERALFQIVQGSTIPTFVINKDHVVTHWNKACEKLTGYSAEEIVGTRRQWAPFRAEKRPIMADLILDQVKEQDVWQYYGTKWRKSALIEGAYEAEEFFPHLGEDGKWLFFTAAPIKAPDGKFIGAIETLWDKTEDKRAEEERERHTLELSTLCSIYGALNAPADLIERISQAVQEVKRFLSADSICIYLLEEDAKFHLRYHHGLSDNTATKVEIADPTSDICHVARMNEFKLLEDLPKECVDEICSLEDETLASLAYIPISSKERGTLGVMRIGSRSPWQFNRDQKDVLELIGNRIAVAIENAMLQDQYIKSEEKYRTLFNSDPHPKFILDRQDFTILDTNQRAQDSYGYVREELLGIPFLRLGDADDAEVSEGLANLTENQSRRFTKKRHYRKAGHPFYVNVNISPTKYGESDVVIASTTDITESVEKEAQLIQAGKMTTLGVMAAGMAHEINQPLNVIQVCADFFLKMLSRGQQIQEDDLKTMANDIVDNVKRASDVIKHVRDFARQSEVVKHKININDPVRDVFKVLGHQLKVHEIQLELDFAPDLPLIMAEHNRLEQVFINLVTNSIDALDEKESRDHGGSGKQLTIRSYAEAGKVVVTVSDTGIGMSEEVKNKIFEPFFTTKKIGKGTGLGISISYGIVKDYEGTISVESAVGEGTTFILSFPALP